MFAVGRLGRYFGLKFLGATLGVFFGIFVLIVLVDYIELMRRASDIPNIPTWMVAMASFFRVPQMTERLLPFSVLIGAMVCYLNLSRRNELVVARAAGVSAWQFVAPAVVVAFIIGIVAVSTYNPLSAMMREKSKELEATMFGGGSRTSGIQNSGGVFWLRQKTSEGQSILNATASSEQGVWLQGITVFTFDNAGRFEDRLEAASARLKPGFWQLTDVRFYASDAPPTEMPTYELPTSLTPEQVRESFATPETVSFWDLPLYIEMAERAGLTAAGYRLQYQNLISRPFLLAAMVLLASAVSLRFFRFGGVQRMILGGVGAGFLLYVLQKVVEDLSKAELMHPVAAAWLPVLAGGMTGFLTLLYQEDG